MRLVIPFNLVEGIFLEVDVAYDVVATGGPPEPPFDIALIGGTFIRPWRELEGISEVIEAIDVFAGYIDPDSGEVKAPYADYIVNYLKDNEEAIRHKCQEFELTKPESMV